MNKLWKKAYVKSMAVSNMLLSVVYMGFILLVSYDRTCITFLPVVMVIAFTCYRQCILRADKTLCTYYGIEYFEICLRHKHITPLQRFLNKHFSFYVLIPHAEIRIERAKK